MISMSTLTTDLEYWKTTRNRVAHAPRGYQASAGESFRGCQLTMDKLKETLSRGIEMLRSPLPAWRDQVLSELTKSLEFSKF